MKDLIQNIETRFQILITLSIFFPSLIYYVGIVSDVSDPQNAVTMVQFGGLMGVVLIDYFIFQKSKDGISKKWLERINGTLLWSFICFAVPISLLALLASIKSTPPHWAVPIAGLTLGTFIVIILAIPVIIELVIIISSMRSEKDKKEI